MDPTGAEICVHIEPGQVELAGCRGRRVYTGRTETVACLIQCGAYRPRDP